MPQSSEKASASPVRSRAIPVAPGRALDFVNTVERQRWIPRRVVRWLMERYVDKHCLPAHRAVLQSIGAGDVVLDLGANVGLFSTYFAARGAVVHAFEPDPAAQDVLQAHASDFPNLTVHQAAVFDSGGHMTLYRHREFARDANYAQSSTLIDKKRNVGNELAIQVPVKDIADVLAEIPGRIKLIKMDIEGAEGVVLRRLLDVDALSRVDHVFVETHEDIVPGLADELSAIKRRLKELGYQQVDFSWY